MYFEAAFGRRTDCSYEALRSFILFVDFFFLTFFVCVDESESFSPSYFSSSFFFLQLLMVIGD